MSVLLVLSVYTSYSAQSDIKINNENQSISQSEISVTVSVNCKNAVSYGADVPEYMLHNKAYTAAAGSTAFDVMKAVCSENGISLNYGADKYIVGINGLNQFDCGEQSGWLYYINGESAMVGADEYVLENGDSVEWRYVTSWE